MWILPSVFNDDPRLAVLWHFPVMFHFNAYTGRRSIVSNLPDYRCVSDCRSRGLEFDPGRSHTFMEIDHEIISTGILLPSADSFKKGCCQLQAKVCAGSTCSSLPRRKVNR